MSGLLKIPFFANEAMFSFISRVAYANGRLAAYSFCADLGMTLSGLLKGELQQIEKLSDLTGVSSDQLNRAVSVEEAGEVRIGDILIGRKSRITNHMRYCPVCWEEDEDNSSRSWGIQRYARSAWQIRDYRCCALHNRRIIDLGRPSRQRTIDFCSALHLRVADILKESARSLPEPASPVDQFVHDRMDGRKRHGPLLDEMEMGFALDLSLRFGIALTFGKHQPYKALTEPQLESATIAGFKALSGGYDYLYDALDRIVDDPTLPSIRNGAALYGPLYEWLRRMGGQPGAGTVQTKLREHAVARVRLPSGSEVFGTIEATPWLTLPRIAEEVGLSPFAVIGRFREAGMVNGPVKDVLIPRAIFEKFRDSIAPPMTIENAARKVLNCSFELFHEIVDTGLIAMPAIEKPDGAVVYGSKRTLVSEREVRRFRDALFAKAVCEPSSEMISVRALSNRRKVTQAEAIAVICSGTVKRVALRPTGTLSERLLVDPREFEANNTSSIGSKGLGHLLRISGLTVARLLEMKLLSHTVSGPHCVIPLHEVETFRLKYVSLSELEKTSGIHRNLLQYRARSKNVAPAFPVEEVKTVFFLRESVPVLLAA